MTIPFDAIVIGTSQAGPLLARRHAAAGRVEEPSCRNCRGWIASYTLTNSSMMGVDFLPPHLIVVGGSYIGLEFGQMFRRFGSEVTILEMGPRLIPREDHNTSAAIPTMLGDLTPLEQVNIT